MLREIGYPIEVSTEEAWPEYVGWRVNYESTAYALARLLDAPPALWSGPRRWPSTPIAPSRPFDGRANRLNRGGQAPARNRPGSNT